VVLKRGMILAATAAVLLTGCEKKPGGQVVAVVNGEEISQQELNAELNGQQIPPGADRQKVMAELLQRVVDRKLLVQKAKEEGLDKTPAYLDQVRRTEDNLLVNMLAGKAAKAIALPDVGAVNQFVSANPSLFTGRKRYQLDQLAFPIPADKSVLQKLAPAHTLDAVAAVLSANNVQFQRGNATLDTGSIPPELAQRIASLPAGEPFVVPANGQLVASVVRSTEDAPTPQQQVTPAATEFLRQQSLRASMSKQLDAARKQAKIEYQPGFSPPKDAAGGAAPVGGAAKAG